MKIELKPCPFCGNEVDFENVGAESAFEDWGITCENCGAFFMHSNDGCVSDKEEVAVAWNKRINLKSDKTMAHLPTPCTNVEEKTVKDWFQKINEELDELKADVLFAATTDGDIDDVPDYYKNLMNPLGFEASYREIAEEAADTITAITSMLEVMGIDEEMRQEAQRRVNEKNLERGRF